MVLTVAMLLAASAVPAFECSFDAKAPTFTPVNYQGRTPIECKLVDGAYLAEVTATVQADTMWGLTTHPFAVTPGYEFFTRFVMSGKLPDGGGSPGAKLIWLDAKGEPLMAQDPFGNMIPVSTPVKSVVAKRDSQGRSTAFTKGLVPEGAAKAKLMLSVDGPNLRPGEVVRIHGVSYFEHPEGAEFPFGDIEGPVLKLMDLSPSANPRAPVWFRLVDASGVDVQATEFKVDGQKVDLASLPHKGNAFAYFPPASWQLESLHRLEVNAVDLRGNVAYDCAYVAYTTRKPQHPQATIRDDGMILLDGEPFFPLGWFRVRACEGNDYDIEKGIAEMKANGMNFAHTYMVYGLGSPAESAIFDQLVAACAKHGVALYTEPSIRRPRRVAEFDAHAQENLLRSLDYRAPIFWGVGDDTSTHLAPDDVKILYRCCKAVDPTALTVSADVATGPTGHIPYAPYVDLLFIENYTIKNPTPANDELALASKRLDEAWSATLASKVPNRSVVAIPQCFKGWGAWKRLPTEAEVRAQAYLSIAQRARGLVYYASCGNKRHVPPPSGEREELQHFGPWNLPEYKESFYRVTREIAAMIPSLVLRDAKVQPKVRIVEGPKTNAQGGDSVRCLLKEDGLLVAANSSHLPVTAIIALPNGKSIRHEFPRNGVLQQRIEVRK